MSALSSTKRTKSIGFMLRLMAVLALVSSSLLFTIQPALAQEILQERYHTPPNYFLNNGATTELLWWRLTFESTPLTMRHRIFDPDGGVLMDHTWDISGQSSPRYNPEYQTFIDGGGVYPARFGNSAFPGNAHPWPIPAGAKIGTYESRVDYSSEEVTNESSSIVTFQVRQRMEVFKYNDLNGDGNYDPPTETPLSGWAFTINGPGTADDWSGTTNASGLVVDSSTSLAYRDVLTPGSYTVTETLQGGWRNTDPGATPPITKVLVAPDPAGVTLRAEFGNQELGRLEIFKYNDLNGDGNWDGGEPGLAGWRFDTTGPGGYNNTSFTNGSGLITLTGLTPGTYTATETLQGGWDNTDPGDGPPIDKDAVVTAGELARLEFGNQQPGGLQVFKYNDLDGDGAWDVGEPGLANWEFNITGPGGYNTTQVTNVSGLIILSGLDSGDYTATETLKPGWVNTDPGDGPPIDKTGAVTPGSTTILRFGNRVEEGGLEVFKFKDINGDGNYDPGEGETPLSNWHYDIIGPGGYNSAGDTDASGLLIRVGLVPGLYTVTEVVKPGWTITTTNPQSVNVPAAGVGRAEFGNKEVPQVPAASNWSIGLMIGGFAGLIVFFVLWRARRYQRQQR